MFSRICTVGVCGMEAYIIEIETDIARGMPSFDIVGLPDASVKEARDRVRAAMKNSGFEMPASRITVNLAPADIRKEGSGLDLPILLGVLLASKQINFTPERTLFVGEISLNGGLRPIPGMLAMAIEGQKAGYTRFFVPSGSAAEGSVVKGIDIIPAQSLDDSVKMLTGRKEPQPARYEGTALAPRDSTLDFADVRGQLAAKRALEIAAAGGHNVLLIGPPGSGKSMLAKRLPSILPDMTFQESIETTKLHSIAGTLPPHVPLITTRPFRAPHHTVSAAGLSGGGRIPKPGEVSLAHHGVLFLDELPEYSRQSMEVLRQPLEDGTVTISRVFGTYSYPCSVMLVGAMNPCPCGYFGHPTRRCICGSQKVELYLNRVSGPILDRLDLHVDVPPVKFDELSEIQKGELSANIRQRVNAAREIQNARFSGTQISCNAKIIPQKLQEFCRTTPAAQKAISSVFDKLGLSARGYDRILKVARTIADLDGGGVIDAKHIFEAVQYRNLDRKYWNK